VSIHRRLKRLESLVPTSLLLTREEKLQRIRALLAYCGNAPDMLARQARLRELLCEFQRQNARRDATGGPAEPTNGTAHAL
jgi:hypothetical protein